MLQLFRKSIAATAIAAFIFTFLALTPVLAVEDPGYGPDSAQTPSSGWVSIAPGESQWYTFHYDYDQIDEVATEVFVEMKTQYEDAMRFEVWTPRTVQHWVNGDDRDTWNPVGGGAKLSDQTGKDADDTTLIWASTSDVSETYYVIVTNVRDSDSSYKLEISGEDVSFPGMDMLAANATVPTITASAVANESAPASAELMAANGAGPSDALTVGEDAGVLSEGESRWYAFKYSYDNSDDAGAPADVTVFVTGATEDALSFEVWNPATVQHWINQDSTDDWSAVGAGSKLSNDLTFDNNEQGTLSNPYENELIWVGSSAASDTYYVIVTNETGQPQQFELSITGSSIIF